MAVFTDQDQLLMSRSFTSPYGYTVTTKVYGRRTALGEGTCTIHYRYVVQTSTNVSGMSWGNNGGVYWRDTQHSQVNKGSFALASTTSEQELFSVDVYVNDPNGATLNAYTFTVYNWMGLNEGNSAMSNDSSAFTAPAGIDMSNVRRGIDSFTANVSLTGWGGGGSTDERKYRELQCWTQGMTEPRRYQVQYGGSLSGDITVSNSSSGSLTIRPNTMYTLGIYAATRSSAWNDGWAGTGSKNKGVYTTLPPKSTLSLNTAGSNSLMINYSAPADGGQYSKTLEYSVDGGTTWVTGATINSGSATTGTFTISNLDPNTQYTIQSRVTTSAGTTTNDNLTAKTIGPATPTLTVANNGSNYKIQTATYGTTSFGGGTNGVVSLYAGTSANPTTLVDSKTTTGTSTFNNTNLQGNKLYYYRARTQADFDGTTVYSDYVSANQATRPPVPSITSATTLQYETASTVTARVQISVPADGGYSAQKKIQYRYSTDGGSTFTAWVDGPVISTSSATTTYVDYTGLPVSTTFRFSIRQVAITGGLASNTTTKNYTSPGQHQPPTNFDFEIFDANTNVVNWLSTFSGYTSPIYVQGQSMVGMRIPEATKGTCSDGATLTKYTGKLVVDNFTIIDTTFSYPVVISFGFNKPINRTTDYPSNLITIQGFAYDSLATYTQVDKSALSLSWEKPTVAVSGERLPTIGTARIDYSGTYARLQDASLNSGNDLNSITVQYRVLDTEGNVLKTWTTVSAPSSSIDTNKPFLRDYSGRITVSDIPASSDCKVEVKITDHFTSVTDSYILTVWDNAQINEPVHCDIELWDWKTNTFVADLSYLVVGELNITWQLNDVEEVSFDMDLMEFEKKCQEMGLDSEDLLKPYAHDIRIRRNGEYIVGCQLVDVDIQISNNPPSKISVKGTGFLNLLKDQYILNEAWSGYTYAQIARKLVQAAQLPDCLVKNPTGDIDTSYWLSGHGTIAYSNSAHSGDGCISCGRSGTGWVSGGTQMDVDTGQTIKVDMWVKGQSGIDCYVRERRYVTEYSAQGTIASITLDGSWQHIQVNSYTTAFENSYILVECNRTDSTNLLIDDCYVYAVNDNATLCNMNIPLGVDTASVNQESSRQVNYELQNVKDALINLTNMEDDNFEFEFEPDRTFNVYERKGADKLDLEVEYPGNVDSMTISRSASNVANKIIALGSGIGDERLQTVVYNNTSRSSIGTRESVTTDSNISLEETLRSKAIGNLYDRKDPTNIPKIVIRDGSINPSNVETGDVVLVEVHGENFIESTTGEYRIVKIDYSLSENVVEKMTLTVERPIQRPEKKMIRYIRDSIAGNSVNGYNHWVEIEALMLVGNEYVDIARGKTVTISFTPESPHNDPQIVVDGNTTTEQNYLGQADSNVTGAVTVDLGSEYPVDYIQVWHYWQDGRSYKDNTLSVGTELVGGTTGTGALSDVLWQYSGTAYVESSQGKRSKWLQEQNVVEG